MFEHLHRKKANTAVTHKQAGVVCPRCRYRRKTSDSEPYWQCPNCGVAYDKVTEDYIERWIANDRKEQLKEGKRRAYNERLKLKSGVLAMVGYLVAATGFSATCALNTGFVYDNPAIAFTGIGLIATGGYYLFKNWRRRG